MFDGLVEKALDGGIVDLHWGRQLRVNHFGESRLNGHGFLAVEISGSNFGFRRRVHDIAHDLYTVKIGPLGGRG